MPKRNLIWWFWLATDLALAWSLLIDREAIRIAIGLAAMQIPIFARRGGGVASFPARVRLAYTALLSSSRIAATPETSAPVPIAMPAATGGLASKVSTVSQISR